MPKAIWLLQGHRPSPSSLTGRRQGTLPAAGPFQEGGNLLVACHGRETARSYTAVLLTDAGMGKIAFAQLNIRTVC